MKLIDSHCHLNLMDLSHYDDDIANVIANGNNNFLSKYLNISVNLTTFPNILSTAKRFDEVWATVGIHPCYDKEPETTVEELFDLAQHEKVIAIGECGLDYYMNHGNDPKENDFHWQRQRFRTHIQAANKLKMPLIVHTRDAIKDTISLMQEENAQQAGGIMHCYVEDLEHAKMAMDMNFMISFSGIVTFKSAKSLQAVAKEIPDEYLLIETDSPYLAPMPFRGKPNQPAFVLHVAEYLAELRGTTVEHIAQVTHDNFSRLFFS
ncbi:MAG: TatD family hydrolase [Gammaproteobacteria bacterium]|nr:TatD family hydrolase [Gammaproteobacteria bacterium]